MRNNLPKSWCVLNDDSQLFKDTVIKYLNEKYFGTMKFYDGSKSNNSYYGMQNDESFCIVAPYSDIEVLSIDKFIELSEPIKQVYKGYNLVGYNLVKKDKINDVINICGGFFDPELLLLPINEPDSYFTKLKNNCNFKNWFEAIYEEFYSYDKSVINYDICINSNNKIVKINEKGDVIKTTEELLCEKNREELTGWYYLGNDEKYFLVKSTGIKDDKDSYICEYTIGIIGNENGKRSYYIEANTSFNILYYSYRKATEYDMIKVLSIVAKSKGFKDNTLINTEPLIGKKTRYNIGSGFKIKDNIFSVKQKLQYSNDIVYIPLFDLDKCVWVKIWEKDPEPKGWYSLIDKYDPSYKILIKCNGVNLGEEIGIIGYDYYIIVRKNQIVEEKYRNDDGTSGIFRLPSLNHYNFSKLDKYELRDLLSEVAEIKGYKKYVNVIPFGYDIPKELRDSDSMLLSDDNGGEYFMSNGWRLFNLDTCKWAEIVEEEKYIGWYILRGHDHNNEFLVKLNGLDQNDLICKTVTRYVYQFIIDKSSETFYNEIKSFGSKYCFIDIVNLVRKATDEDILRILSVVKQPCGIKLGLIKKILKS